MALCHRWYVKNGFAYVLKFFSLISDGLGGVSNILYFIISVATVLQLTGGHKYVRAQKKVICLKLEQSDLFRGIE